MYKDKDKQREANRKASRCARIKRRVKTDLTPLVQGYEPNRPDVKVQGMTPGGMTSQGMTVIDERPNEPSNVIPKRSYIGTVPEVPGVTTLAKPKRGKDIKCFADLPPDIRRTIEKMSIDDAGQIDKAEKAKRTAIAIDYQHKHPDRYYSTGVA